MSEASMTNRHQPKSADQLASQALTMVSKALTVYTAELVSIESMRMKASRKYFEALERAKKALLGEE